MEEPTSFGAEQLRAEKTKVLAAIQPPDDMSVQTCRGQYVAGRQGGERVLGYREEDGVDPHSRTETYAAVRLSVDNRRWAGVPFYLRTAKRMPRRVTEVALNLQRAPHLPFSDTAALGTNAVVLRIPVSYTHLTLPTNREV